MIEPYEGTESAEKLSSRLNDSLGYLKQMLNEFKCEKKSLPQIASVQNLGEKLLL
jgi:hypothetical protein